MNSLNEEVLKALQALDKSSLCEVTFSFFVDMEFVEDMNSTLGEYENNSELSVQYLKNRDNIMIPPNWDLIDVWVSPDNETIEQHLDLEVGILTLQFARVMDDGLPPSSSQESYEN